MKGMVVGLSAEAKLAAENSQAELLRLRSTHPDMVIQLVSMKKLPSAKAVLMIAAQTLRARDTGSLLTAKPEVDLLLRLSGTSQITVALKKNGYMSGGLKMLVAAGTEEQVQKLKEELLRKPAYRVREAGKIDQDTLGIVEAAALLGTRT
jgi:tRNA threonylcarbamoyladenosine modification (KEOPS) complex Cgi121 subunit